MKIAEILVALESGKRKQKKAALTRLHALALNGQGKEAMPSLIKLADVDDEELRFLTIATIDAIDGKSHLDLYISKLTDSSPQIRGQCAFFLSRAGRKAIGYPVLRALLTSTSSLDRQWGKFYTSDHLPDFSLDNLCPAELNGDDSPANEPSLSTITRKVTTKFGGEISVEIQKCTEEDSPTNTQLETLALIEKLPKRIVGLVRKELERRLAEDDPDDDGETLDVTFLSGMIPPLRHSESKYFLLAGDSDYDVEHGFACLFRNGTEFCVCDPDLLRTRFATDDCAALDEVLRTQPTVSLS